jgi:recombinational DNA repair protein (RecF pathway)
VAALAHASYGTELARELCAADVPEPGLHDLLIELYATIAARGARPDVLRAFEIAVLDLVGLGPTLDRCAACGRADDYALDRGAVLDPGRGGAVCSACAPGSRGGGVRPLPAGARALLSGARAAASAGGLAAVDLAARDPGDAADARGAMLALVHHHLGKQLRTLEFLDKMNRPAP